MSVVTICTFNVKNLYGRYKVFSYLPGDTFKRKVLTEHELAVKGGFLPDQDYVNSFEVYDDENTRELTKRALKGPTDNYPDIACLQEVESMQVLRRFNDKYMGGVYKSVLVIDCHDPRLIDVAVLSKHPIIDIKSYMDEPYKGKPYTFSRDCLEVSILIGKKPLTLFVNHLKSKFTTKTGAAAEKERKDAGEKRRKQCRRVAEIVRGRFPGSKFKSEPFVVLGDFNDQPDSPYVKPLVKGLGLEDVVSRFNDKSREWTHFWKANNTVSRIDFILLSPKLARSSKGAPYVERRGLTLGAKNTYIANPDDSKGDKIGFGFDRWKEVTTRISASDHCPVHFTLTL